MSAPDVEQMRRDFRDAALFWAWGEDEKREFGDEIKRLMAAGDADGVLWWRNYLAQSASDWREIIARRLKNATGAIHG